MPATCILATEPGKPVPVRGVLKYDDVIAFLEAKYGFNQYNVSNYDGKHFERWYTAKGLTREQVNATIKTSQDYFKQYSDDPAGLDKEPENQNFWHWILFHVGLDEMRRKKPFIFEVGKVLDSYDNDVAPQQQLVMDAHRELMLATLNRFAPAEFAKGWVQQNKPKKATLPDYVVKVLGYMRSEFGDTLKMRGPDFNN